MFSFQFVKTYHSFSSITLKIIGICLISGCFNTLVFSQDTTLFISDSLQPILLEEVVINSNKKTEVTSSESLDELLQRDQSITMVRRGAYAWEPQLNGMTAERSIITYDGMRIYNACSDKMDPITSYFERSNIKKINTQHGAEGNETGSSIAGSINLLSCDWACDNKGLRAGAWSAFESNNNHSANGGKITYSTHKTYSDITFSRRKASNYKAGGNESILYSQFEKNNLTQRNGLKINDKNMLESFLLLDYAKDIGYPALPMDVAKAFAQMYSIKWDKKPTHKYIKSLETKVYHNRISHLMDDSHRPNVPIRMDMPGWSNTTGAFTKAKLSFKKHFFIINANAHSNISLSSMTMYPDEQEHNSIMFMYTWPNIRTTYASLYLKNSYFINQNLTFNLSTTFAWQKNKILSEDGLRSLQIFYPKLDSTQQRLLPSINANIEYTKKQWTYSLSAGKMERAPSTSELFGYYLFNNSDGFDYVGNPLLNNEKAISLGSRIKWKHSKWELEGRLLCFWFKNYIIGRPLPESSSMTIDGNGIKIYQQNLAAHLTNIELNAKYHFTKKWVYELNTSYRTGVLENREKLPFMQPLSFSSFLSFNHSLWKVKWIIEGAAKQNNNAITFAEKPTEAYCITNLEIQKELKITKHKFTSYFGVQNILNTNYTTYSDWNKVPRMGRSFFARIEFNL